MKTMISAFLGLVILPTILLGQFSLSGELMPNAMVRSNDASLIDLPFRPATLSLDYSLGDIEVKTVTALETRWKGPEFNADMVDLREAYLIWYPAFGEVKVGKMIHAWGAADANNPTDNLSPYDYYYMFLAGTDRKLGNLSLVVNTYLSDFQVELVILPEFEPNRFPLNEPDFPIELPVPAGARHFLPEDVLEFGGRVHYSMGLGDISASYFKGHDRSFSPAGLEINLTPTLSGGIPDITSHLTYRNTDMFGLDAVFFPGNWTLRSEFAYFRTQSPDLEYEMSKFIYEAEYLQSVVQIEYTFANTVQLMGQLIGQHNQNVVSEIEKSDNLILFEGMTSTKFVTPEFSAGMGTPFALIADQVAVLSSMVTVWDNSLELNGMVMMNLQEKGYMSNLGGIYSIREGLNLEATWAHFIGGEEEGNRFKQLEDFSHVKLGLSYSF